MASKFLTNIDLVQNQILNGRFETVGSDPESGNFDGRLIYNSTEGVVKVYDNDYVPASGETKWRKFVTKVSSSTTALGTTESNGVITLSIDDVVASGASGLITGADKQKLDDASSEATASKLVVRDANSQAKFGTPTDAAHAATKGYVDAARQGLDIKQSVRAATTAPLTIASNLEAGDTLDTNVTLVAGDRVLVKNQSTASENGIYIVQASGAAVRAADADGTTDTGEVSGGTFTFVEEGTLNGDTGWVVTTDGAIDVGTDAMVWTQFSGTGMIVAGDGLDKDGATLSVNVDETTIEIASDTLRIAAGAAGDGLSGGGGSALAVNVAASGGIEIASDNLQIKLDPAVVGLATTGDGLKIDSSIIDTTGAGGFAYDAGELSILLRKNSGGDNVSGLEIINPTYSMAPSAYPHGLKVKPGPGLTINASGQVTFTEGFAGSGLTLTDGVLSVDTIDLTTDITGVLPVANGGTGASTRVSARNILAFNPDAPNGSGQSEGYAELSLARIMAKALGNGADTVFTVNHDFGTKDVIVQIFDVANGDTVIADVVRTTTNAVTVTFSVAPTTGAYRAVVTGANPTT